jgi:rRNA maturation endonuclease Nob1
MSQNTLNQIVAGLFWGLLWTAMIVLVIFLVFPILNLTLITGIALICVPVGIFLNLRVVEQPCPKCGTIFKVMPTGSKCPSCGHFVNKN